MSTREALHQLVDELPEAELHTAQTFLEFLRMRAQTDDPMLRALEAAPLDDEPTTPEEDQSAEAGWREYQSGEFIAADEAKRRLLGRR